MKSFDGEFYLDATVIVFKEYQKSEYDVFVDSIVDFKTLSLRKNITLYPLTDLPDYFKTKRNLAGFNNQAYDNQLLMKIIKHNYSAIQLYSYSKSLIEDRSGPSKFKRDYSDYVIRQYFDYVDLFKVNHYDFRGRSCSLKKLEFNYRRKKIKDLPHPYDKTIDTPKKLTDLILYCCEDVDTTEECYTKSHSAIMFRVLLNREYSHIPNFTALNFSDVKIGDFENLQSYMSYTGLSEQQVRGLVVDYSKDTIHFKDCIPDFISFRTPELKSFFEFIKSSSITVTALQKKEDSKKKLKYVVKFDDIEYTIALGGIHSKDPARRVNSDSEYILVEADCGSQYPSELIKRRLHPRHLESIWIDKLQEVVEERLYKWKPLSKEDDYAKAMADRIKLRANGGAYGKLGESYNWQYDPQIQLSVTLSCQLQILMLIERLYIVGIRTISANTDGILVKVKRTELDKFYSICFEWEQITLNQELGKLEFSDCEFMAQSTVNDYILQKTNGDIKRKGDFMIYEDIVNEGQWHKDSSARIIPLALQEYFVNNIPIEDTINSHNNIYDFCIGVSKTKAFNWVVSELNPSTNVISNSYMIDRLIRYYIGGHSSVSKRWVDERGFTIVEATAPLTIAQTLGRSEIIKGSTNAYPKLDREWYIAKANKIKNEIINQTND